MWEEFTQWLTNVTNNPTFIALMSILTTVGSILVIISKTSFGKKAILKLTQLAEVSRTEITKIQETVNEEKEKLEKRADELTEAYSNFTAHLDTQFKVFFNQFDFYETQMYEILKLVPNAKVQEKLEEFYSGWQDKKKEIEEFIGLSYSQIEEKLSEKDEKIAELENKMNDLLSMFEELKHGREERIDDKTEEE